MTGKDKTEDQLLSSIRKNKPSATEPTAQKTTKKVTPRKKTVSRAKPKPSAQAASGGNYQSGRRVWPD
ncbi:hypothetical protein [Thiosocius teredinicola]|uniref:hypothetical protein n=1 Tax=Thiosocius teredinicola TaxID=1973002 RepID=UPI000990A493